jgi:RNA polymerase sigma-70 factor (ECF subfamily)
MPRDHQFTAFSADSVGPGSGSSSPSIEFVTLFLAHQRRLYWYIALLMSGQQDVDDVLQETAVLLWRKFDEFEAGTNFYAWACKTAYLVVMGFRRREDRQAISLDDDVLSQIAVIADTGTVSQEMRIAALESCLDKLPSRDRELIERWYLSKAKVKDIALTLGRPEKTVSKSLGRIRRALHQCISRMLLATERNAGIS